MNLLRLRWHLLLFLMFLGWCANNDGFRLMLDHLDAAVPLHPDNFFRSGSKVNLALRLFEPLLFFHYSPVCDLRRCRLFGNTRILLLNEAAYVAAHQYLALGEAILEELLDRYSRFISEVVH